MANKPPILSTVNTGHAQAASLIGAWPLNENAGQPADLSTGGRNGTRVGTATWGKTAGVGPYLSLPAAGDYASLPSAVNVNAGSPWSLAFNFRQTSTGVAGVICGVVGSAADCVWAQSSGTPVIVVKSTGAAGDVTFTLTTGDTLVDADYLLIATGTQLSLYRNGVQVGSAQAFIGRLRFDAIGYGYNNAAGSLVGRLGYVHAWSVAKSAGDATTLAATPFVFYTSPAAATAYTVTFPGTYASAGTPFKPVVTVNGDYTGTITLAQSGAGLSGNLTYTYDSWTPRASALASTPASAGTAAYTGSSSPTLTDASGTVTITAVAATKPNTSPTLNANSVLPLPSHAWLADAGAGPTVKDYAASGASDGTIGASVTWGTGGFGSLLTCAGGASSTQVSLASPITLTAPFTVIFRAKESADDINGMAIGNRNAGDNFAWLKGTGGLQLQGGSLATTISTAPLNTFTSHSNIAFVCDGVTVRLYKNGAFVASAAAASPTFLINTLCGGHSAGFSLTGEFDHAYTFPIALTDDQVLGYHVDPFQVFAGVVASSVAITTPAAYKVHQRSGGSNVATIPVTGTYVGTPTTIEYRWDSGSWATLDAAPTGGAFSGSVASVTGGYRTLSVRFSNDTAVTGSRANVYVGEIFPWYGQSNPVGQLTDMQTYTAPGGVPSSMFRDGSWQALADPVFTSGYALGSPEILFANRMAALLGVPIGIIVTAYGSQPLATGTMSLAPPSGQYYAAMLATLASAVGTGGVRAVCYYQGETDASNSVTYAAYLAALQGLADAIATDIPGAPPLVAMQIGYGGGTVDNVRLAIGDSWGTHGIVGGPSMVQASNATHPTSGGDPDALGQIIADGFALAVVEKHFGGVAGSAYGPALVSATATSSTTTTFKFDKAPKTGRTHSTAAFVIYDAGVSKAVSGVAYHGTDPTALVVTHAAVSGVRTASYMLGTGTASWTGVVGPDVAIPGSGGTLTNLPARPFRDVAVTSTAGVSLINSGASPAFQSPLVRGLVA